MEIDFPDSKWILEKRASEKHKPCSHTKNDIRIEYGFGGTIWQVVCKCGKRWLCEESRRSKGV